MPSFLDELAWRGLLSQTTEGAADALNRGSVSGYVGFDPTGSSMHVGHLVQVMGLVHLQRSGHSPVALVGGGTGMIGDPSGRSAERNLISLEQVAENAESIRKQLERFLDFSGAYAARMRNNADWLMPLTVVGFLRDVGKHFSVNVMLARESVKSRLETGISYTEFSYMLLQAYDFQQLYLRDGVTLQMGGSDQWGNITAGTELIRRSLGGEAHGVTLPLITTADGKKFGKTAEGTSVWLDPARTSPYRFYQFWINADDRDVGRYLRFFSLLGREEIEGLEHSVAEVPEAREAQRALAADVTARVHGVDAMRIAADASRIVFDREADPRQFAPGVLEALMQELPSVVIDLRSAAAGPAGGVVSVTTGDGRTVPVTVRRTSDGDGIDVADVFVATALVKSKGDARRLLQQGGLYVNGDKLAPGVTVLLRSDAIHGAYYVLRKGARDIAVVKVIGS